MITKFISSILGGTRTHPTLFDTCWYTYSAIRKFLEDSVMKYRKDRTDLGQLKVLDFGCGNQPYKYIFEKDLYYGCDIGDSPEFHENLTVITEGAPLPYEDNTFDLILCTEVMEHIKFPEFYSQEFSRILKPGGVLIITVPQIWNYHPYPQHFFNYTPDGLNLFLSNKFTLSRIYSDTTPFQTGMMLAMMYSDLKLPIFKAPYIFLTNILILAFPKYRTYNCASTHIFAEYIK